MSSKWIGLLAFLIVIAVVVFLFQRPEPAPEPEPEPAPIEVVTPDDTASTQVDAEAAACPTPTTAGTGANQAGLLVTYGDGTSQSICVSFDGDSITGYQLLQNSGLDIVTQYFDGLGEALCKITGDAGSDGCDYPTQTCFCDSSTWVLFVTNDQTTWTKSDEGMSKAMVSAGGAQAQLWGNDTQSPPSCFFADICGTTQTSATDG